MSFLTLFPKETKDNYILFIIDQLDIICIKIVIVIFYLPNLVYKKVLK